MFTTYPLRIALVAIMTVGLTTSVVSGDEATDQYAVAAGLYFREQWKLAAQEFETYLNRFPKGPKANEAVFFLAEAQLQLGQQEQAAQRFEEYLRREPAGPWTRQAMFRAGEASYLTGHGEQARPQLEQFVAKHPSDKLNAYSLTYLGQIALAANDYRRAEEFFRRCLQQFPEGKNQDECRYGLARALDKQGASEEAERLYLAVAGKPGSDLADNAQFYLGALQYAQGRFEEALKTFGTFDKTFPQSPLRSTVQLGRGWALLKLNRPDDARKAFQGILEDPKVGIEARYWLGLTQKQQSDWKGAATTLLEAAAVDPKNQLVPSIRLHAGDALLHAGDIPAAAGQYDQVLAAVGPDGELADDAVRGRAQTALLAKDYATLDRLTADFAARYPKSPLQGDIQRIVARSLVERKEFQRAVKILEPRISTDHSGKQALEDRYLLSLSYEGLLQLDDALKVLTPVLASATGQLLADAQLTQGSQLVGLKRFKEAIVPLEAFLATKPEGDTEVKARGLLAVSYARTGQLPQAKEAFQALISKHPQHELMVPITEQLAEAAYEAKDTGWSQLLFQWQKSNAPAQDGELRGLSGLAWSQFKAGNLEGAAATFEQVLQKNPDPQMAAESALVRGQILQKLAKPDQALTMYELIFTKYPQASEAPAALWAGARLHDSLDQHQAATTLYQRLVNEHPKFAELDAVLYKWAWSLHDQRKAKESLAVFERLHKDFPQSRYWADATFRLAQSAFEAKDYAQAGKLAETLLNGQTEPTIRENAIYLSGQAAAAQEKWEPARKAFETLLKDHPQSPLKLLAEYGIAETLFRQNDYAAAVPRLQTLVDSSQGRSDAWLAVAHLRLAQALVKEKRWDDAYAVALPIAKQFPDFPEQHEVDYVLGRHLANKADFEGARQAYHRVINSPSGTKTETAAKAQFMIAETFFHQKNYEEALREYLRLEILYAYPTWQAAAMLQAAKSYEQLGEWQKASETYTKLLKTFPQTEFTQEATERQRAVQKRLSGSGA